MMSKLRPPPTSFLDPYRGQEFELLYAAAVTVDGGEAAHGRASGIVRSDDKSLDVELRLPAALGGEGGGPNPEQLFAAGYGACFHGALNLLARRHGITLHKSSVQVTVGFGRDPVDGRYGLTAHLVAYLPGLEWALAQRLVRETERLCPYSKMVRQSIEGSVRVDVSEKPAP
jgi:lipoyl-dependent peroxiredoxin